MHDGTGPTLVVMRDGGADSRVCHQAVIRNMHSHVQGVVQGASAAAVMLMGRDEMLAEANMVSGENENVSS